VIVFVFALFALFFALRVVCTLLFLSAPLVLVAHGYLQAIREKIAPDPDTFINTDLDVVTLEISLSLDALRQSNRQYYVTGDAAGLKRTDKSGGARFDARKAQGRELNEALEATEQEIQEQQSLFDQALQKKQAIKNEYAQAVRLWLRPTASARALWFGLAAFSFPLVLSLSTNLGDLASSTVLLNPFDARGPIVAACILGALIGIVAYRLFLRGELSRSPLLTQYDERSMDLASVRFQEIHQSDAEGRDEQTAKAGSPDETWYEVLNVDAEAPTDQIKAAYRVAIKQYHPDSLQGRGCKILELAEQETRRLNEAYGRAREARSF